MLRATVTVTLKNEVSDPQGHAVRDTLDNLHPGFAQRVRVGKILHIDLKESDREKARAELDKICREVLSNPVIEEYAFEIEEVTS
ncbi:phosphoribosylformylglycinamidine synthase subunit PurS [Candidatus Sumerlaeota bacterium]|nr:phosphoribosylformylglycinamidine synthase subunit PurS [Candidatus Sumerlaeota bacterium]